MTGGFVSSPRLADLATGSDFVLCCIQRLSGRFRFRGHVRLTGVFTTVPGVPTSSGPITCDLFVLFVRLTAGTLGLFPLWVGSQSMDQGVQALSRCLRLWHRHQLFEVPEKLP